MSKSLSHRFSALALSLIAAVLAMTAVTPSADAAQVSLSPNSINVTLLPGEQVELPFAATLSDTRRGGGYVNFNLNQVGGDLDPSWVAGGVSLALDDTRRTGEASLLLQVPADAANGSYTGVFGVAVTRSSEFVNADTLALTLEVNGPSCGQAPVFSAVTASQEVIRSKNDKPVTIVFKGSVNNSAECTIAKAWFQLTDEYGELSAVKPLAISDGTFEAAVALNASRKGNDKDGRLYTLTFFAENEAGVADSGETRIVVAHDNR